MRVGASMQLVIFTTGMSRSVTAKPIMGPPWMTRSAVWASKAASSSSSRMGVPSMTRRLPGFFNDMPVTVVIRSVRGLPSISASRTATAVLGFWHRIPMSAGMPPEGTCMSNRISMSCFSPPEGYLVGKVTTSAISSAWAAFAIASAASGLLSSTARMMFCAPTM